MKPRYAFAIVCGVALLYVLTLAVMGCPPSRERPEAVWAWVGWWHPAILLSCALATTILLSLVGLDVNWDLPLRLVRTHRSLVEAERLRDQAYRDRDRAYRDVERLTRELDALKEAITDKELQQ